MPAASLLSVWTPGWKPTPGEPWREEVSEHQWCWTKTVSSFSTWTGRGHHHVFQAGKSLQRWVFSYIGPSLRHLSKTICPHSHYFNPIYSNLFQGLAWQIYKSLKFYSDSWIGTKNIKSNCLFSIEGFIIFLCFYHFCKNYMIQKSCIIWQFPLALS